jgi:hypothetical protein
MRQFLIAIGILFAPAVLAAKPSATAPWNQKVQVGPVPTEMGIPLLNRKGVTLQNRGPSSLFCALNGVPVLEGTYEVISGGEWPINVGHNVKIFCICATAQTVGAETIVVQSL